MTSLVSVRVCVLAFVIVCPAAEVGVELAVGVVSPEIVVGAELAAEVESSVNVVGSELSIEVESLADCVETEAGNVEPEIISELEVWVVWALLAAARVVSLAGSLVVVGNALVLLECIDS